jgi:cytochrome c peroxidase
METIKTHRGKGMRGLYVLSIIFFAIMSLAGTTQAINLSAPPSLKFVPVPEPVNLNQFVLDRNAAIRLGKALFWDMQVGSDGIVACATCHFHAGADSRIKNQLNSGVNHSVSGSPHPDSSTFELAGPNSLLTTSLFPFPFFNEGPLRLIDDEVVSSAGVFNTQFVDIVPGSAVDLCNSAPDPVYNVGGINIRRVEPRNTPTVINAVFNEYQFWDGRANDIFNGVNPFGRADVNARITVNDPVLGMTPTKVALDNSSLASQAVGPPLSDFEMSCAGRTFPKIGKKMLSLIPLAKQMVHPEDSVLGSLSRALLGGQRRLEGNPGISTTYADMIKAAFQPKYWNSNKIITFPNGVMTIGNPGAPQTTDEFTQMEANFSLFFGLALQMYQSTLVSNDTPFDRFQEGNGNALTLQQQRGLNFFLGNGRCIECHLTPLFTGAVVPGGGGAERMIMGDFGEGFYDSGFYNVGVTLNIGEMLPNGDTVTTETYDIGRGGADPFGNPLSNVRLAFLKEQCALNPDQCALHPEFAPFIQNIGPCVGSPCDLRRAAVDGAFKTPGLRNLELTGPYFHNGSAATLLDVVEFYDRGGNFAEANILNLDPAIVVLGIPDPAIEEDLMAFMRSLTDERVPNESAPFDHPQILIPNGHPGGTTGLTCIDAVTGTACDDFLELPALGAGGRPAEGLLPIQPFTPSEAPMEEVNIKVAPASVALGDVNVGSMMAQAITVTNTGVSTLLAIGQISLAPAGDFALGNDQCSNQSLAPAASCTVQVKFTPSAASAATATLSIPSNDPDTPAVDVALSATGILTSVFTDVGEDDFAEDFINSIYYSGITGGCGNGNFCPDVTVTRAQMAVFIVTALGHSPRACPGQFSDVSAADPSCGFIERLAEEGITGGCGNGKFCPNDPVTRGQMAVFMETALGNPANAGTGRFTDVPADNPFCGYVERIADDGIAAGCGNGKYCVDDPITRAQMAVFLATAFLY